MLDLIIKNGEIIDGSGRPSFKGDIGIKDSTITKISEKIEEESRETIDANRLVVSPGFIDIHGHSDFTLYIDSRGESKIHQGITTEVVGNCGFTAAPVVPERFEDLMSLLANTAILSDEEKKKWKWATQADFIEMTAEKGLSYNIAPLVGQGTIKVGVMGFETRKPTPQEMQKMIDLLVKEMDRGLYGLSTGLEYEPGSYTTTEELVELCKVVSDYGGIYTTHMKNEGRYLLECIEHALEIADKSGVSLEISHLKAQYRQNWGKVKIALEKIDKASESGIKVDFDVYPYIAFGSGLIDLIPPWAKAQGASKMVELLKDSSVRARVIEDMKKDHEDWENPMMGSSWEDIRIAMLKTEKNKKYEGKNLAQIAQDMGVSPYDAVIDLLIQEDAAIKCIYFAMCEEDLETIMKHPKAMFCTDGRAVAPYGPLGRGSVHPRYYGTYPRILGHYVRERKVIPLEEAIMKMTYLPAKKLNLKNRGLLKEGYVADITIFDKENVIDVATFDDPHRYPRGIEYVIVNGKIVIYKGEHTGKLPGKVLKRNVD